MPTTAAGSMTLNVRAIPTDLCTHTQWVVWRYGTPRSDGKHCHDLIKQYPLIRSLALDIRDGVRS
jgi:hypothetical protein